MKVVLTNNSKNITITFQDHSEFVRDKNYQSLYGQCYIKSVNEDLVFKAVNWVGFWGNNTINPYSERGAQEDGINFLSNYLSERTISWQFDNVFIREEESTASHNNLLNYLLMEKNDIIRVEVYSSKFYYQDFFVTENTNTEIGVIELKGAYGDEIFWNSENQFNFEFFNFDKKNNYLKKNLPQNLLKIQSYPFTKQIFTNYATKPIIKIGGNNTGVWASSTLTNNLNGKIMKVDNLFNDKYLTINCETEVVTNQSGVLRIGCITGDYISFDSGINDLQWKVNDTNDYNIAQEYLPLDFNYDIIYIGQYVGVE